MKELKTKNVTFIRKNKLLFGILLVALGILSRTLWHIGPNIEFVTAATLLSSFYLGRKYSLFVPLFIMAFSDMIIGNTIIFIFTWSAYIIIGVFGSAYRNSELRSQKRFFGNSILLAIISSIWFYLWTNFGVWLLDGWGMYPKTFAGLVDCYIMAIPFFKNNLLSNVIIIPASFAAAGLIKHNLILIISKQGKNISKL